MYNNTTVSIAGCGWYGLSLAKALVKNGFIVKGSTTSADRLPILEEAKIKPYVLDLSSKENNYNSDFFACDILWVCIPPKVRSGNGESYLIAIDNLIKKAKKQEVRQVILISSTSVYADDNSDVNELTTPMPDSQSGKVMLKAEELLKQQTAFTTTIIRFAGLIGPARDPGRFFGGKKGIPNGKAPVNLIHLSDCIGVSLAILGKKAFGYTYNACAPTHPTKQDFYTKAAQRMGLEKPEFIDEKKDWKIISSLHTNTILNYRYQVSQLMDWLDTNVE